LLKSVCGAGETVKPVAGNLKEGGRRMLLTCCNVQPAGDTGDTGNAKGDQGCTLQQQLTYAADKIFPASMVTQ
jgi:hypothetical protein